MGIYSLQRKCGNCRSINLITEINNIKTDYETKIAELKGNISKNEVIYKTTLAAARLEDGVGTRLDICDLLKDSQYINENISENKINNIVSGALDRLHYQKDPCVKYDSHFLKGYTSEKRDTNIGDLKGLVETQSKDIARFAATPIDARIVAPYTAL